VVKTAVKIKTPVATARKTDLSGATLNPMPFPLRRRFVPRESVARADLRVYGAVLGFVKERLWL
jgi:hypothetical protein